MSEEEVARFLNSNREYKNHGWSDAVFLPSDIKFQLYDNCLSELTNEGKWK